MYFDFFSLSLPHLSHLAVAYVSQSAFQRSGVECLQSAAGFTQTERKTVMVRDFPTD